MIRPWVAVLGLGIAGVGVVVAVVSPDLSLALVGGGIAVASAGVLGALWVLPGLAPPATAPAATPRDALGAMQGAFTRGSLARERVIFTVQALEFASGLRTGRALAPEEVRTLLALPREPFANWLESHLDALERGS